MKILIIGQGDSIHTVRCINIFKKFHENIDFHLFRSSPFEYNSENLKIVKCYQKIEKKIPSTPDKYWEQLYINPTTPWSPTAQELKKAIEEIRPDIVHLFALQEAGYLLNEAFKIGLKKEFKVICSSWGNDFYYFGKIPKHIIKIKETVKHIDLYQIESFRDVKLGQEFGYYGKILPVSHITTCYEVLNEEIKTEEIDSLNIKERKIIFIRGSYEVRGRALTAITALKKINEYIDDYEILINNPSAADYAAFMVWETKAKKLIGPWFSRSNFIDILKKTKIFICLNTTDGTPQSYLESAMSGAYPIFSKDTGLKDYKSDNVNNLTLVDPDDPWEVAESIKKVINDEKLFEIAFEENKKMIAKFQKYEQLESVINNLYK